jgi:hypothetical protein
MGECLYCALNDIIEWGRYACTCGESFCAGHKQYHQDKFPLHQMMDKEEIFRLWNLPIVNMKE